MKKQIIIAVSAVLIILTACFAGGNYYLFHSGTDEKILSLELPPFSDDIILYEGETLYEQYFEVLFENGFSTKDITFVSEDESVAEAKYSLTDRNRYVCYKVKANSVGETYIYFTANSGETMSDKIKIVVLPKVSESSYSETTALSAETTTELIYNDETEAEEKQTDAQTAEHTTNVTEESTTAKTTENVTEASKPQGNTVYITPTGKRYHYSKSCAGKNATAVSKSDAEGRGLTPCQKCTGG